jgi:hypothetical protein
MEIRELSLIKNAFFIVCVFTFGCSQPKDQKVDLSQIPNDTIVLNNAKLKLQNGVYYQGSKPYSGYIKELYETKTLKSIGSYFATLKTLWLLACPTLRTFFRVRYQ